MRILLAALAACAALLSSDVASGSSIAVLPNGWVLGAFDGPTVQTGTLPQGAALSPDGTTLAVVESGFNPPALTLYATQNLASIRRIPLKDAQGRPLWTHAGIAVAGASAGCVFVVDPSSGAVRQIRFPRGSYPVALAARRGIVAVASAGDDAVRLAPLDGAGSAQPIRLRARPASVAFANDGETLFVALRAANAVAAIDLRTGAMRRIRTGLHPGALLVSDGKLYVAESDADSVGEYDGASGQRIASIFVGTMRGSIGSSPNALAAQGDAIYVSLGAANEIAVLRGGRVAARLPTGWYPTDVVPMGEKLFAIDGKGEGTKPNPQFDVMHRSEIGYIAATEYGSVREITLGDATAMPNAQGAQGAGAAPPTDTIVRAGGPIRHVFFILKENRTYDQILGDMPEGNGDPRLVVFGERVTPNQHALARRFGLFDNAYASGEVSDAGHNWADGAFANDYVERTWPVIYGGRLDDDDLGIGRGAAVPARGYIWDAAQRSGISFRDYGEMTTARSLRARYDPRYVGWDLEYSDLDRVKEWRREFDGFLANGTVPQFEFIWLPNDHTHGTSPGELTPAAYIAQNDYALGLMLSAITHSKIWGSSAIFITEDDAQNGADHVSDQRTTAFVVSPYARGGLVHEHYATVGILRTIELLLGMAPLSNYDASAVPLYAAFGTTPNLQAYDALPPQTDLTARNAKVAYGANATARLDYSRPDAVP